MKQEQRKALIKLAAEMALCNQMPSRYYADWDWPKGMQVTSWRKVFDAAQKAENQCKNWAVELRRIADNL
mgnify:CR=1 FL=1|jgi:hypothetical protein